MLYALSFCPSFINLVMSCVCIVRYVVHVNGQVRETSMDLRQGDSFFPYLFMLCKEGLATLIHHEESISQLHGLKIARERQQSHIFFCCWFSFVC